MFNNLFPGVLKFISYWLKDSDICQYNLKTISESLEYPFRRFSERLGGKIFFADFFIKFPAAVENMVIWV